MAGSPVGETRDEKCSSARRVCNGTLLYLNEEVRSGGDIAATVLVIASSSVPNMVHPAAMTHAGLVKPLNTELLKPTLNLRHDSLITW